MSVFQNFLTGQQARQQQNDRRQEHSKLAQMQQLAVPILAGDMGAYAQGVAVDPAAANAYHDASARIGRSAENYGRYIEGARKTGSSTALARAWKEGASLRRQVMGDGFVDTPDFDEEVFQGMQARAAMFGGGGGRSDTKVVGSTLVDSAGNVIFEAPTPAQYVDVPDGNGGKLKMVFDPRTRQFSQPGFAAGQSATQPQQAPAPGLYNTPNGPARIGDNLTPEQWQLAQQDMAAGGGVLDSVALPDRNLTAQQFNRGGQLGYTPPKPAISPAEQARLDIARRGADRADAAAADAAEARRAAAEAARAAAADKQQKAGMAQQQALSSIDHGLATIKRLREHPGYSSLGTARGDAATAVPLIRTEAKGANAILETVKSQVLINTLSSLKAASATGASGFGSLTEKEGAALQAAISNLTTAQSHEDLDAAISEVEAVLTGSRALLAQGSRQTAPATPASDAPRDNAIRISNADDYNNLPSGAIYISPDGMQRRKR